MAEAIAALSLAANIAQFVVIGVDLTQKTKEILHSTSGLLKEDEELAKIVTDLRSVANQMPTKLAASNAISKPLRDLAADCEDLSIQLLGVLRKFEIQAEPKPRKRESLRRVARSLWERNEIKILESRLSRIREEISFHLTAILCSREDPTKHLINLSEISAQIKENVKASHQEIIEHLEILKTNDGDRNTFRDFSTSVANFSREQNLICSVMPILKSLQFNEINWRHSNIVEAHKETFEWIFSGEKRDKMPDFPEWLQAGQGIFWVSGKAGSGKSTLMKFLANHEKALTLLNKWSHPRECIISSFFFWNAGTSLQKSQEGLYRTLLYQIWRQCPELVPDHLKGNPTSFVPLQGDWTIRKLRQYLHSLGTQVDSREKFCFFIDGLDEYEGEEGHEKIIEVIQKLSHNPHIKICISSRPWTIFRDAFEFSTPRFFLHELTANDMMLFINDTLVKHPKFQRLADVEPNKSKSLAEIIHQRAEGVFLWTALVVKSLIRGLIAHDKFEDLERRLDEIPRTVEKYLQHMFDRIDPIYQKETAQIFLLLLHWTIHTAHLRVGFPSLMMFHFIEIAQDDASYRYCGPKFRSPYPGKKRRVYPREHLKPLGSELQTMIDMFPLQFRDVEDSFEEIASQVSPFILPEDLDQSEKEWAEVLDTQQRRISSRCQDFVVIEAKRDYKSPYGSVVFLHRCAIDFLKSADMFVRLTRLAGPHFNAEEVVLNALVAELTAGDISFDLEFFQHRYYFLQLKYFGRIPIESDKTFDIIAPLVLSLLWAGVALETAQLTRRHAKISNWLENQRWILNLLMQSISSRFFLHGTLCLAAFMGSNMHIKLKIRDAEQTPGLVHRLLTIAVFCDRRFGTYLPGWVDWRWTSCANFETIHLLLQHGADPNFCPHSDGKTTWQLAAEAIGKLDKDTPPSGCQDWFVICSILIEFGARSTDHEWDLLKKVFPKTRVQQLQSIALKCSVLQEKPSLESSVTQSEGILNTILRFFSFLGPQNESRRPEVEDQPDNRDDVFDEEESDDPIPDW